MLVLVWITERFSAETQKDVNAVLFLILKYYVYVCRFQGLLPILGFKNYITSNKQLDSNEEREACITF